MKKVFILFVTTFFFCSQLFFSVGLLASEKVQAPDFTLKSQLGKNIRLSDLRGNIILLNFWGSWCGPCRQEMPILDQIHKKYSPLGFHVLGVNIDSDSSKAVEYLSSISIDFPVLYDSKNTVSELYNVSAMPSTAIIDRDGYVRYVHEGYVPGDEKIYHEKIKALMRE
jgi:peroxiredoxin